MDTDAGVGKDRPAQSGARSADRSLMRLAAELYYVRGWSQAEISRLLRVSISTVSRLLAQARAEGIVQITVERDPSELIPLATELADALSVRVTLTPGRTSNPAVAARVCAVAAAPAVADEVPTSGVLGTAGGYTIAALAEALPRMDRPELTVVPIAGGLHASVPPLLDINGVTDRIAAQLGASTRRLLAPGLLDSLAMKEALLEDSLVKVTTELWSRLDCVLVGVSGMPESNPGYPTVMDQLDGDIRRRLIAKGVVGEIAGHPFTIDGSLIEDDWASRLLCISFDVLRRSGPVIVVAAGSHKAQSIIGCVRTGVVGHLYTDELTAAAIMEWLGAHGQHRGATSASAPTKVG
ncbi:MAG: sugar-binding domain-containing protein [Candidatus Limnocylindrales bacterium]